MPSLALSKNIVEFQDRSNNCRCNQTSILLVDFLIVMSWGGGKYKEMK